MEDISIPPFEVGDRVVCVNIDPSTSFATMKPSHVLKLGKEYTVTGVYKHCCIWTISVGVTSRAKENVCAKCKKVYAYRHNEWPFASYRFRKVQYNYSDITAELAQEAIKERVEVDGPIKILQNN